MPRNTKPTEAARLKPEQLRWRCDPAAFRFDLTSDIEECLIDIIGQPRALAALRLGFDLKSDGYNIFVAGEVGTGRSTTVRKILSEVKDAGEPPIHPMMRASLAEASGAPPIAVVSNMTPALRSHYRLPLPRDGAWREVWTIRFARIGPAPAE